MLTYKAMYRFVHGGVHTEALDFPGVVTCAENLPEARRLLAEVLVDIAETCLLLGESLPCQDSGCTDPDADLEEPIHSLLTATSRVRPEAVTA
ncbi:MAG: hypothetical protein LM550_00885 [Candidatus Contendobacter sp.]|jgi:hypothetical protein|nr:hypothetical protein [Gammaproteobacteria bacterium]MCC8992262.1 hypothetical protein [Candidatus Contendobacter sp.]